MSSTLLGTKLQFELNPSAFWAEKKRPAPDICAVILQHDLSRHPHPLGLRCCRAQSQGLTGPCFQPSCCSAVLGKKRAMSTFETKTRKRKRKKQARKPAAMLSPRGVRGMNAEPEVTVSRRPGPSRRLKGRPLASPGFAPISLPWEVFTHPLTSQCVYRIWS